MTLTKKIPMTIWTFDGVSNKSLLSTLKTAFIPRQHTLTQKMIRLFCKCNIAIWMSYTNQWHNEMNYLWTWAYVSSCIKSSTLPHMFAPCITINNVTVFILYRTLSRHVYISWTLKIAYQSTRMSIFGSGARELQLVLEHSSNRPPSLSSSRRQLLVLCCPSLFVLSKISFSALTTTTQ